MFTFYANFIDFVIFFKARDTKSLSCMREMGKNLGRFMEDFVLNRGGWAKFSGYSREEGSGTPPPSHIMEYREIRTE